MFYFSCCVVFLACFCCVLCVSWSGLGVVLVLFGGLFCLCLFFASLCLFLSVSSENHCSPCNSSVFLVSCSFNLCFSFQFLVLAFYVCFLFQDVLFFFLLSCFVLSQNIRFVFALHLVFLLLLLLLFVCLFCCFGILLLFLNFGYLSKISLEKLEIPKTPKWKMQKKKRTFWQQQLAQVCSQIVSFCFSFWCL